MRLPPESIRSMVFFNPARASSQVMLSGGLRELNFFGSFMPDRIEYVERGGDTVSITLERIEIDAPLGDETFVLDLPEDVEITELLDEIK